MISTLVLLAALSNGYEPVPELHKVPGPAFLIPCKVQAAEQVAEIHLYVSADRGKTWQLYEVITPTKDSFTFVAKKAGEYWFAPRVKKKDGKLLPGDLAELAATQRVAVAAGSADGDGPPPAAPRRVPAAAATADGLDDELTRVELDLIRKEIKRLADVNSLTPEVQEKIDRLRVRLEIARERTRPRRDPLVPDPASAPRVSPEWSPGSAPLPPPTITPSAPPADDLRIPPATVPTLTPGEGRPVAPPPRAPAPPS